MTVVLITAQEMGAGGVGESFCFVIGSPKMKLGPGFFCMTFGFFSMTENILDPFRAF